MLCAEAGADGLGVVVLPLEGERAALVRLDGVDSAAVGLSLLGEDEALGSAGTSPGVDVALLVEAAKVLLPLCAFRASWLTGRGGIWYNIRNRGASDARRRFETKGMR